MENKGGILTLMKFTKIIHIIFISSCLFLLTNSLFFFHIFFIPLNNSTILFFVLSATFLFPSITSLMTVILKYFRDSEVSVFKTYFYSYKTNFKYAYLCGCINTLLMSIFIFNFFFIKLNPMQNQLWLIPICVILFGIVNSSIYQAVLITRFNTKFKPMFILSWYYIVKYKGESIRNTILVLCTFLVLPLIPLPVTTMLLAGSLTFALLINMRQQIQELEKSV